MKLNPERFRSDEARRQVMRRIASVQGDLEVAIRRELGADEIPPKAGPAGTIPDNSLRERVRARRRGRLFRTVN